jgi:hypothetical protein
VTKNKNKKKKKTGRYLVELDPEIRQVYQKLSENTQIPLVRLVNTALKGMEGYMTDWVRDIKKEIADE